MPNIRTKIVLAVVAVAFTGIMIAMAMFLTTLGPPRYARIVFTNRGSADVANVRVKTQTRQLFWPNIAIGEEVTFTEDGDFGMISEVQWEQSDGIITRELDGICEHGEVYYIRIFDHGEVEDGWGS